MKKILILTIMSLFYFQFTAAQNINHILNDAQLVEREEHIFLKYKIKENEMKFDIQEDEKDAWELLSDTIEFMIKDNTVGIHLRPLNPLNYSYKSEKTIAVDPVSEAAELALGSIISEFGNILSSAISEGNNVDSSEREYEDVQRNTIIECDDFKNINESLNNINKNLKNKEKEKINSIFSDLKKMSFERLDKTEKQIKNAKDKTNDIINYYAEIDTLVKKAKDDIDNFYCPNIISGDNFTVKYILKLILKDLTLVLEEQKKRLANLNTAINIVNEAFDKAKNGSKKWFTPLDPITVQRGKISNFTITIYESGLKLRNDSIITIEPKKVIQNTVQLRKFQRFIPEVSVGTAFTFLEYNTYGTVTDSTGQQYVSSPIKKELSNLKITTMVNFNYYITNSYIHPFVQIGLGINSEVPTFLTGLGIRTNSIGINKLTVSGGIAMTWLKELNELSVGDKISGTAEIEKDFKYDSTPKFTPYIGLQYSF